MSVDKTTAYKRRFRVFVFTTLPEGTAAELAASGWVGNPVTVPTLEQESRVEVTTLEFIRFATSADEIHGDLHNCEGVVGANVARSP